MEEPSEERHTSRTTHFQIIALPSGFTWRLVAANGRERARSALTLRSVEECLGMIGWLRPRIVSAPVSVSARDADHVLTWTLDIDGVPAATASGFQRRIDLDRALTQFRDAAVTSRVDPVILRDGRSITWTPRKALLRDGVTR